MRAIWYESNFMKISRDIQPIRIDCMFLEKRGRERNISLKMHSSFTFLVFFSFLCIIMNSLRTFSIFSYLYYFEFILQRSEIGGIKIIEQNINVRISLIFAHLLKQINLLNLKLPKPSPITLYQCRI